ncbi:MAG: hypothetical protein HRU19_15025 [Pseudobacteriovorax sp.]|nr:hypothetical protein [Pseudobacteriovorax sp.]
MGLGRITLLVLLCFLTSSCSTDIFRKYSKTSSRPGGNSAKFSQSKQGKQKPTAAIVALDGNTYRFHQPFPSVWNSMLDILLENYNLNIVDRRSGIITTEWDSFYIGDTVYRNKLSVRLKKVAFNMVDITLHNSVEALKSLDKNGLSTAWLPAEGGHEEKVRILQNMAISLNLPKPVIPNEQIARNPRRKMVR